MYNLICSEDSGFNLHFCEIDPLEVFDLQRNRYFKQYGYINMWIAIPYYISIYYIVPGSFYVQKKNTILKQKVHNM